MLLLLLCPTALAQDEDVSEPPQPRLLPPIITSMQAPIRVPPPHILKDGTPIALRVVSGIKAKDVKIGDVADVALDHDLWQGDMLIAKEGAPVKAIVVEASKAKWLSRGSRLGIDIQGLRLLNGQTVQLRGTPRFHGGVGTAAQISGGLADQALLGPNPCLLCEVVCAPAALVSLAAPGSNKNVAPNTVTTVWVNGDIRLDIESFRAFQAKADAGPARVLVVRGELGLYRKRDLYCNGVPLAFLQGGTRSNSILCLAGIDSPSTGKRIRCSSISKQAA
jgi:hypothetical protein